MKVFERRATGDFQTEDRENERLKQSNLLAFRIHFSITEMEEGGERGEEEPKGQRQQELRLQCVLGM